MRQQLGHRDRERLYTQALTLQGLRKNDLVLPVFVSGKSKNLDSMPGVPVTAPEDITPYVERVMDSGISSVIVFGIPERRDARGSGAADGEGLVQRSVRELRSSFGKSLTIITDVCLCQYNLSGHCGFVISEGRIDNDSTLDYLGEIAASHSEAGADEVAPSSMMDGQVQAIRNILADRGLQSRILSYSAKHASTLYAPFRSAAFARPTERLDKSSYQVSYANPREVLREIEMDIGEGAHMVMVKPALVYLDLVRMAKERFDFPIAVQNVSGEYAMIKAAAGNGWIDEEEWKVLTVAAIKRAGADRIISYFSLDVVKHL